MMTITMTITMMQCVVCIAQRLFCHDITATTRGKMVHLLIMRCPYYRVDTWGRATVLTVKYITALLKSTTRLCFTTNGPKTLLLFTVIPCPTPAVGAACDVIRRLLTMVKCHSHDQSTTHRKRNVLGACGCSWVGKLSPPPTRSPLNKPGLRRCQPTSQNESTI